MRYLWCSTLLFLMACPQVHENGHHHDDTSDTAQHDYSAAAHSDGGSFYVVYASDPDPIPLSDEFSITLMVYDGADTDTMLMNVDAVATDADMPDHDHGMNVVPVVVDNGNGTFTASPFAFHMPGYWEINVDVTVGETTERATFSVDCCE